MELLPRKKRTDALTLAQTTAFYLYGAGPIARRFYRALQRRGLAHHVIGFLVTRFDEHTPHVLEGVPVCEAQQAQRDQLVFIAAHEMWKDEIIRHLRKLGFSQYVFVANSIFDFEYGYPIERGTKIEIKSLVRSMLTHSISIPVYYSVIHNFFHPKKDGDKLYLKCYSFIGSEQSAKGRLDRFHEMIRMTQSDGLKTIQDYSIKVNESKSQILDGLHRTTLALWGGISYLKADVYQTRSHIIYEGNMKIFYRLEVAKEVYTSDELREIQGFRDLIVNKLGQFY